MHTQRRLIRPPPQSADGQRTDGRTTNGIDWRTDDATRRGDHWTPAAPAAMRASKEEFPSDGVLHCASLGLPMVTQDGLLHNNGKTERKIQITEITQRRQWRRQKRPRISAVQPRSERARRPQTLNATNGQTEPGAHVVDSSLFPSSEQAGGCHAT